MKNSIVDLMAGLENNDEEKTWELATRFFEGFGFHITNFGIIDKTKGDILGFHSNMDDDWMAYYMTSEYGRDDPWAHHVISNPQPVLYSRNGCSELIVEEGSIAEKMIKETGDYGLDASICIPIHNNHSDIITGFNLGSRLKHDMFHAMLGENKDEILLGAAMVNNKMLDMTTRDCNMPSWYANPHYKQILSERELEVLKWLSEGNRNDRIAEKMNIASVTVNFHLKEINRKLGAKTREQSVALAFKKGLLR